MQLFNYNKSGSSDWPWYYSLTFNVGFHVRSRCLNVVATPSGLSGLLSSIVGVCPLGGLVSHMATVLFNVIIQKTE